MKKLRAIYFWTPGLSAEILKYLLGQDQVDIVWVVTNPDKIGGRGHQVMSSSVAQLAREKNLKLLQPEKIRDEAFLEIIRVLQPDICLVVAYGKILPQVLLDIPPMGFLNVHTSLLPKYRWAAPIQHALLAGEKTTGLTVQQMALGMDEGDILVQESWDITPEDTTGSLFARTGERGWPLLIEAMKWLIDNTITPIHQNHDEATYTKMIEKKDGELNPEWTLDEAYHAWQAYTPWPSLFTFFWDTKISLLKVKKVQSTEYKEQNEGLFIVDKLPAIALQDGYIILEEVHPAGKKSMTGEEFVRGFMK